MPEFINYQFTEDQERIIAELTMMYYQEDNIRDFWDIAPDKWVQPHGTLPLELDLSVDEDWNGALLRDFCLAFGVKYAPEVTQILQRIQHLYEDSSRIIVEKPTTILKLT